jgi:hypothetical protein
VAGRTFYLADYEPIEVFDLANRIRQATHGPPVRAVPGPVLRMAATAGDALQALGWRRVPLTRFRLDNLLTEAIHDIQPMRRILPELPTCLDDGVSHTVRWLRDVGDLGHPSIPR